MTEIVTWAAILAPCAFAFFLNKQLSKIKIDISQKEKELMRINIFAQLMYSRPQACGQTQLIRPINRSARRKIVNLQ